MPLPLAMLLPLLLVARAGTENVVATEVAAVHAAKAALVVTVEDDSPEAGIAMPPASEPVVDGAPPGPTPAAGEAPATPDPTAVVPTTETAGPVEPVPPEAWLAGWRQRMRVAKAGLVVAHTSVPLSVAVLYVGALSVAMHDERTGTALLGAGLVGVAVVAPLGDGLLLYGSLGASRSLRDQGGEVPDTAGRVGVGLLVAGEACLAAGILGMLDPNGWGVRAPMLPSALLLHYGAITAGTIQRRAALRACPECADIVLAPAMVPMGPTTGTNSGSASAPWVPGATVTMRW